MFVQIVNFKRRDMTHEQLIGVFDELAPAFAAFPGLLSKIWLQDPEAGSYGGVYMWEDEAAAAAFADSELYAGIVNFPNLEDLTVQSFGVVAGPTKLTRGYVGAHA